jgi:hypothetical protein
MIRWLEIIVVNMGNLLERCGLDLSEPVVLTLVAFTSLSSLKLKEISRALAEKEPLSSKLLSSKAFTVLEKHFESPGPLVRAFTFLYGTQGDEFIDIYCLVAALCFYSNTSPLRKARCKIYLVLFRLFVKDRSRTLRLQELTKLIKSLIVGTRRMTGQDLPKSQIYKVLAEECLAVADYKHIKRINSEE